MYTISVLEIGKEMTDNLGKPALYFSLKLVAEQSFSYLDNWVTANLEYCNLQLLSM